MDQPPPTRVLFVHANAEWYGSDRSFVLLVSGLVGRGWQVTAVVPAPGEVSERLRAAGVTVVETDPGVPRPRAWSRVTTLRWLLWTAPRSCWRMWRLARCFDLVHLNTSTILGAAVGAVFAHRPIVLHLREHRPARSLWWRSYVRVVRRFVVAVVAISSDIGHEARRSGFGDRVVVVHNGLRFRAWSGEHQPGVLNVGRINRWKGQHVLIDAIGLLRRRGLDVPVVLAGDAFAGDEDLVEQLVVRAHHQGVSDLVSMVGFVDDVDALYRGASIFVSPTTAPEPFGLALLDAMAAGLVPIATDGGGPRDIVRHGATGLLIPMGDPTALAEAIDELWSHPAEARAMGDAAAADVRARFDIDRTVDGVDALYRQILSDTAAVGRRA